MADNNFNATVAALFNGIDGVVSSKTVVGDAIQVGDITIIPLVDVSFALCQLNGAYAHSIPTTNVVFSVSLSPLHAHNPNVIISVNNNFPILFIILFLSFLK